MSLTQCCRALGRLSLRSASEVTQALPAWGTPVCPDRGGALFDGSESLCVGVGVQS